MKNTHTKRMGVKYGLLGTAGALSMLIAALFSMGYFNQSVSNQQDISAAVGNTTDDSAIATLQKDINTQYASVSKKFAALKVYWKASGVIAPGL